jgi:hypothetical protein
MWVTSLGSGMRRRFSHISKGAPIEPFPEGSWVLHKVVGDSGSDSPVTWIHPNKVGLIEYEEGDKVVITKEWIPHGPNHPPSVGHEGTILEIVGQANGSKRYRIQANDYKPWWYVEGFFIPSGAGSINIPTKKLPRVIN